MNAFNAMIRAVFGLVLCVAILWSIHQGSIGYAVLLALALVIL